ncbi:reverse transcriptase domain-containing protein [Tanacetum coccineum]|uniref:Reverse transcriptase domain-containing protein n=1 Tax=Tanacetum coccineum TaxID=301880 RepID=A0ABQ5DN89_9ASTR
MAIIDRWPKCYKHPSKDALDSAAGGNFLDKMPQEGLAIIESKSKVRYSRNRANDSRPASPRRIKDGLSSEPIVESNESLVVTTPATRQSVREWYFIRWTSNFFHRSWWKRKRDGNKGSKLSEHEESNLLISPRTTKSRRTSKNFFRLQQAKPNLPDPSRSTKQSIRCEKDDILASKFMGNFPVTILILEALSTNEPLRLKPEQGDYSRGILKDLKVVEPKESSLEQKMKLPKSRALRVTSISILKNRKQAIAWKLSDIRGIDPEFCSHKILLEDDYQPSVQHQRRVNPKIHDVIKKEVEKLLDAGLIYPISDSPWVSPVHCVPKKGGMTVVTNEENELVPTRLVTGWRVCIDYRKLNEATCKDHFPLPFMDQMLERLAGNEFYCFLDGFSGYFQIPIDPKDQEKTTFTCPYGTFAYRRMPFGLCNAPGTFQRCMMAIFHDMIEKTMEVFMDDFSVFGDSFSSCLANLDRMLKRCEDTKLALNWEKSHFMVKEGIVLGHKISRKGIEVDKAKVDVISKLPHPTTVKGIRTMTEAETNYTTTEKRYACSCYAIREVRSYLIIEQNVVYTTTSALKYLFNQKDSKQRLPIVGVTSSEFCL